MASRTDGAFLIRHPLFPASRCAHALSLAREFFALPDSQKQQLAIEQSPHFRGYSVMHNPRDWREQLHLGREEPISPSHQLHGPNLWPCDPEWKAAILALMRDLETAARDVLRSLALSLGAAPFLRDDESPYLVMKLIHYQELPNGELRSGVAPHVDFSWITLLLQDGTGGLEFRTRDGEWLPIEPTPGTLVVNIGEILEFATRGYYAATPHRVVSGSQSRISIPFFLNPALETRVEPLKTFTDHTLRWSVPPEFQDGTHVHRVFSTPREAAFVYGDEEWKRKGLGIYCESCFQRRGR
jgi:isopenicillin N synthase-like dioxygenase